MHEARVCQTQEMIARKDLGDEFGGPLDQAARLREPCQTLLEVAAGVTLGMGDDACQPAEGKPPDKRLQAITERPGSRLKEHPPSGPAERHRPKLAVAQLVGLGLR